MPRVVVAGGFDDLRARDFRFLEEAAALGSLIVLLWPDDAFETLAGKPAKFAFAEREYLLRATRFVDNVLSWRPADGADALPQGVSADIWLECDRDAREDRERYCRSHGIAYRILTAHDIAGFPQNPVAPSAAKKVVVTGCYDWFHSGHVRFFEEASALGDLTVVVGNDANVRELKGAGHPMIAEDARRYVVGAIKYVKQALISSGMGWLDADPEIQRLKPDYYVVNEDGDRGGKRDYCAGRGIEYVVLKRVPAPGLPPRSSTDLRGF